MQSVLSLILLKLVVFTMIFIYKALNNAIFSIQTNV